LFSFSSPVPLHSHRRASLHDAHLRRTDHAPCAHPETQLFFLSEPLATATIWKMTTLAQFMALDVELLEVGAPHQFTGTYCPNLRQTLRIAINLKLLIDR